MQRGFASILVLLSLVLVGAAVLVATQTNYLQNLYPQSEPAQTNNPQTIQPILTPTSDLTTSWKIYIGKDFTFKYPNNWSTDNSQIFNPSTMFKGGNGGSTTMYSKQLWFAEVSSSQTLDQYINKYYGNQTGFKMNDIIIESLKGKSFYNPLGEGTFGWYVAFSNGKNILLFGPSEDDLTQNTEKYKIISTFSFTDQTTDTSNWKTYVSTNGNFSVNYPNDWNVLAAGSVQTGTETIAFGPNITNVSEDNAIKIWIQLQSTSNPNTSIKTALDYKNSIAQGQRTENRLQTSTTTVNGITAYRISYTEAGNNLTHLIFSKGQVIYDVLSKNYPNSDQIFTTLKFTK